MVSNRVFCTCTSANRRHASHPSRTDEITHRFVARRVACVMRAFQHAIAMVSAVHVVPCRCTVGAPSFPPQKKSRFFSRASQQGRFRRRRARPPASPAPSMRALASRATSTCASLDVHPSWPGPKRACGRHQAPFFAVSTRTHQRLALVPTLHAVFDDDARVAHLQKRACACDDAASEVFVRVNRTCDSCCETMDEDEMKRTQACTGNVRDPPPGISKCE